ncbi:unnamed protein product [Paramecium sonneborni]|uniref:Uncharacterized protein n=1 Tax=Paramecium sonneborni TaxID=65129 RepID=A0A8S1L255_9CILI|nr:unnamed protein product [Paramecium sonneborni]
MNFKLDSNIFENQDQSSLKQLISFLSLDIQFDGQQFQYKDDKQWAKFQQFRQSFNTLKEVFPNFKIKLKPKFQTIQQQKNQSQQSDKEFKNSSTQIQTDKSLPNSQTEKSNYKSFETPTDQGDSQFVQIHQKVQQINDSQKFNEDILTNSQYSNLQLRSEIDDLSLGSFHEFPQNSSILNQNLDSSIYGFDDKIQIKYQNEAFTIQLKDKNILYIIEQLFLEKWNLLIQQLNLNKQSMNCYKLQLNTDFFYINQEIQTFIESIILVEIQFCFYSCYTMKQQESKINQFLQSQQIHIAQVNDDFYLVSTQQSQSFLQDILSQIQENYRGYMLYFANIKPYSNYSDSNPILEKSRYLYYKKYLATEINQYGFNQYFNENFFFIEMNFSQIQENRELVEKYFKQYVGGFIKNLFLLKFSIQTTLESGQKLEKNFQSSIDSLKLKILFYKNNDDWILFGVNEDIMNLLSHLEKLQFTIKILQTQIEFDQHNYLFKFKGAQQKIDLNSVIKLLYEFGFQQVESKNLVFSSFKNKDLNFIYLIQILKFLCSIREQNNNKIALQTFHQKFITSIDNKDLKKEIACFSQINSGIIQQLQQQVLTLNIRSDIQQFPISQTISLNPIFLDEIIVDNNYQDFFNNLVKTNQKIQFQKISQGNYQIQCMNKQVVTQFQQYFDQFYSERLDLDRTSLSCFELSHYLQKEMKKRSIFWKITEEKQLYLITRNTESLKYIQELKQYKGKIIYMLSLNCQNFNEKIEFHELVLARTNYFKYKLLDFLKQLFKQIKEIEFREEQEISSFCIIHSNQVQYLDQCIEEIQKLIGSQIFLEIKTKPEFGKKFLEKIIVISDLYVSQIQQYSDYYIKILGNKNHFKQINQLIQNIQIQDEQFTNLNISFYIEQFLPYKNIIQKKQDRAKFKLYLESQGCILYDTNIKWKIEIRQQISKITIFSILAEWMNQEIIQTQKNQNLLNLVSREESLIQQNFSNIIFEDFEKTLFELIKNENNQINNDEIKIQDQVNLEDNFQKQGVNYKQQEVQFQQNFTDNQSQSETSYQDRQEIQPFDLQILAEFKKSAQQISLPINSKATQFLQDNNLHHKLIFLEPHVDQNYKKNFFKQTCDYVELYVIQKQDKIYEGTFSKRIIYWINAKKAIEKFIQSNHQNQILIFFKAKKSCNFTYLPNDQEKICLMEDNQVLPYIFGKKK